MPNRILQSVLDMIAPCRALQSARSALYTYSDGSFDSGNVRAAKIDTLSRIYYFESNEFRNWVDWELGHGRQVFWLKDVDMTQAAGDIFTFFFHWQEANNVFTREQRQVIADCLSGLPESTLLEIRANSKGPHRELKLNAHDVLRLWRNREDGGEGISLLDVWRNFYWPSQVGLTREEKLRRVTAFAPNYAEKIYPYVAHENKVLARSGVEVVIVSNGDEELATAVAPLLGIKPGNVVGSPLQYGPDGLATGENHSYETFAEEWADKPQPGKVLNFHYWLHKNRHRWGWNDLNESKFVIAGRDGDSASADGGMMIMLPQTAIGNFMVDTPGEPKRIEKFYKLADRYGWTKGQFITLHQEPSTSGRCPHED